MALWMTPVILFGIGVLYALSLDVRRWWTRPDGLPEAIRWWCDQRRELHRMQRGEDKRAAIFDQLEAEWNMPCAPDPKRRIA